MPEQNGLKCKVAQHLLSQTITTRCSRNSSSQKSKYTIVYLEEEYESFNILTVCKRFELNKKSSAQSRLNKIIDNIAAKIMELKGANKAFFIRWARPTEVDLNNMLESTTLRQCFYDENRKALVITRRNSSGASSMAGSDGTSTPTHSKSAAASSPSYGAVGYIASATASSSSSHGATSVSTVAPSTKKLKSKQQAKHMPSSCLSLSVFISHPWLFLSPCAFLNIHEEMTTFLAWNFMLRT